MMEPDSNIKLLILSVLITFTGAEVYTQPEQIHLSYGNGPTEMVVTWVTMNSTDVSIVEYGQTSLNLYAKGSQDAFIDGGSEKRKLYVHRVKLTGLKPGNPYVYHVGSPLGWSAVYSFFAMKDGTDWGPRFALIGDMGNVNAKSLGALQEETQLGHFDSILHVGDFAYDLATDNARVGDAFMNQIESVAAYVPYMSCVGNHENAYNFSNYMNRFTMPAAGGDGHNMFFSYNVGPVHIVSFSSEYYYYTQYGWLQIANQYKWLEEDLREANLPENRAKRPWIISMCHRPLYCSNSDDPEHCPNLENIIRVGLPYIHAYGIEDLLYEYGVDVHFTAHEHSYERMWPVYNLTVCNGTTGPYINPDAPVHIVTGSGGNQEGQDPFERYPHPWSANHSDDYGYTRMTVYNGTHLNIQQVSVDNGNQVVDEMNLVKTERAPYTCHQKQGEQHYKMPEVNFRGTREEYRKILRARRLAKRDRGL